MKRRAEETEDEFDVLRWSSRGIASGADQRLRAALRGSKALAPSRTPSLDTSLLVCGVRGTIRFPHVFLFSMGIRPTTVTYPSRHRRRTVGVVAPECVAVQESHRRDHTTLVLRDEHCWDRVPFLHPMAAAVKLASHLHNRDAAQPP